MTENMFAVTSEALLSGFGELLRRANTDSLNAFVENCNKVVHKSALDEMGSTDVSKTQIHVVNAARRIVTGENNDKKNSPIMSIFNKLNKNNKNGGYHNVKIQKGSGINYAADIADVAITEADYSYILKNLKADFETTTFEPENINTLLDIMEINLSYVPACAGAAEELSFYDESRLTAAVASIIYSYLSQSNSENYKAALIKDVESAEYTKVLFEEESFIIASCGISGIQPFIYTVSSDGALKGLRTRSFYLEIMLEHIVDELLDELDLSRANILYTGGGNAYMLLPNTDKAKESIKNVFKNVNRWLLKEYETSLFVDSSYAICSANDLLNIPAKTSPYADIFKSLSEQLSKEKVTRYSADEIRELNRCADGNGGRECSICGHSSNDLIENENTENGRISLICTKCKSFKDISNNLIKEDNILFVTNKRNGETSLELPDTGSGRRFLYAMSQKESERFKDDFIRVYSKNGVLKGVNKARKIWMGDYYAMTENGDIASFQDMVRRKKGIKRLAVLRADVDNLGKTFMSGFEDGNTTDIEKKYKNVLLSRTAALSHSLSLFFKLGINSILACGPGEGMNRFSLSGEAKGNGRKVTIVYSGGDDVFLVGAWDEVIEAVVDIRQAFKRYSEGSLHFSAGIGMFDYKYPLSLMANETAELEEAAKHVEGKDSVFLFGMEVESGKPVCRHTYKWNDFIEKVVGEKLRCIQKFYRNCCGEQGITMLFRLLDFLLKIEKDRINIARFAYLLGRLSPPENKDRTKDEENKRIYDGFCQDMYSWAIKTEDRKQLITAMYLFIYLERKSDDQNENIEGSN